MFSDLEQPKTEKDEVLKDELSSSDEDDDLPCAISPKKKPRSSKHDYYQGDLVFAKFRSYPWWPALVS